MGAAGGIGTCSTRSGRSRRSDRTVGTPPPPRQVASAGAGAVLSPPAARCRRPRVGRAGAGSPGAGSCRHRRPRGRRHLAARRLFSSFSIGAARPQTSHKSHASHTLDAHRPFRAGRLLRRHPARGAAAGTRRHAPRGSPSAPPLHPATPFPSAGHPFAGPHPTRPSPLPALCLPARP